MTSFRSAAAICSTLLCIAAHAAPVEPGVSKALATARAARLSSLYYALDFHLTSHTPTIVGHETLTFTDAGGGDLALDYRDGTISVASLNGKEDCHGPRAVGASQPPGCGA